MSLSETPPVVTDEMLAYFDECLVTAVRKMGDSPESTKVWRNLRRMSPEERHAIWYAAFAYLKVDGFVLVPRPDFSGMLET